MDRMFSCAHSSPSVLIYYILFCKLFSTTSSMNDTRDNSSYSIPAEVAVLNNLLITQKLDIVIFYQVLYFVQQSDYTDHTVRLLCKTTSCKLHCSCAKKPVICYNYIHLLTSPAPTLFTLFLKYSYLFLTTVYLFPFY